MMKNTETFIGEEIRDLQCPKLADLRSTDVLWAWLKKHVSHWLVVLPLYSTTLLAHLYRELALLISLILYLSPSITCSSLLLSHLLKPAIT